VLAGVSGIFGHIFDRYGMNFAGIKNVSGRQKYYARRDIITSLGNKITSLQ